MGIKGGGFVLSWVFGIVCDWVEKVGLYESFISYEILVGIYYVVFFVFWW